MFGTGVAKPITNRIYNPTKTPLTIDRLGLTARLLEVRSEDSTSLTGIVVSPRDKLVLLVLHGSGTSADDTSAWLTPVAEREYGLILAEYRGFAGNFGRPPQQGLAMDASTFLRQARVLFPDRQLYIVGHSLGEGVAFGNPTWQRQPVP